MVSNLYLKFSELQLLEGDDQPFGSLYGAASSAVLTEFMSPQEIIDMPEKELLAFLAEKSRNRISDISKTSELLRKAARDSYRLDKCIATGCTVKDCHKLEEEEKSFFNLNTVNGFHSFIKKRYDFYQGVATKYLNRYNALFAASYRNAEALVKQLCQALLNAGSTDYYHSNRDVREKRLLVI